MADGEFTPFLADSPVYHGVGCDNPTVGVGAHKLGIWVTDDATTGTLTPLISSSTYVAGSSSDPYGSSDSFELVIRHDLASSYSIDFDFSAVDDLEMDDFHMDIEEHYPTALGQFIIITSYTEVDLSSDTLTHTLISGANPCGNLVIVDWQAGTTAPPPP